jgi:hypothetical protein
VKYTLEEKFMYEYNTYSKMILNRKENTHRPEKKNGSDSLTITNITCIHGEP